MCRQRHERQEALKLLRKVELIVGEVSVRLLHLTNQAEDAIVNEGRDESDEAESSTLNSCTCTRALVWVERVCVRLCYITT